jgi:hypothetical protein
VFQFQFAAREADDIEIKVRTKPLSASRLYLETNIYLDRLGTNVGKTQQRVSGVFRRCGIRISSLRTIYSVRILCFSKGTVLWVFDLTEPVLAKPCSC